MSEVGGRLKADDALSREADAWVMLIASRSATEGDAVALRAWRDRSAAHEAAWHDAVRLRKAILTATGKIRAEEQRAGEEATDRGSTVVILDPAAIDAARRSPARLDRRQVLGGAIAASVAGAGILVGGETLGLWDRQPPAEFVTRKGERRAVQLADGVSIELNTATRLSRRPDLGARAVELFEGEMMLTASPRTGRPFLVLAGGGRTVAEEGRISLRCQKDAVSVTCLAGRAKVQVGAAERLILPGQQLRYDDGGLGEPVSIDPAVVTAWRSGVLVFRRARVGDVIDEIARYREGRIIIASSSLADRRIDGTFHIRRVDQIFDQLRSVYGAGVTHLPGGVVVLT